MLIVTGHIEQYKDKLFIGWTDQFRGLVVEADSLENVKKELWTSIKVKVAYDTRFPISQIKFEEVTQEELDRRIKKKENFENEYEIHLM